jgi:cytochrome c-type biogenesis protein CcmF
VDVPPGFDGPGPNPLLQNHILVAFHPPLLYLGYVGFTVPFAFAIGALITGRLDEGWLLETRRWTLIAWAALTGGIVLGAWWSYEVLGWGGYWAWDPVENASFLPWLTGTAYIHSVLVQERRHMLRVWNLALLCATFSLTILGTFLTRSGVVASVHAFTNSGIGPMLLGFFALIVAVSVGLIGWRGDRLRAPGRIDSALSREAAFFANNVLFSVFAFVVLLGTVFPLLIEAVRGQQISVGEPYFDRMATPIGLCLLSLMAVAPVLPWRSTNVETLGKRLFWPGVGAFGAAILALAVGATGIVPMIGFILGGFASGSAARQLLLAMRRHGWRGLFGRVNGGMVVHLGTIIVAVALTAAGSYERRGEFEVLPGESAVVGGHTVTYIDSQLRDTPVGAQTRFAIDIDGQVHHPAVTRYDDRGQVIGTPSVKISPFGDVYVSVPGVPDAQNAAITMRVVVLPLVSWLWFGGIVMVLGTFFAFVPGVRRPTDPTSAAPPLAMRSKTAGEVTAPSSQPAEVTS